MERRLPPLSSLRGFEVAARTESFSEAARALNLTQSAISHQVKALEESLGQPLFIRRNRQVILTDAGFELHGLVREVLDRLETGVRRLNAYKKPGSLIVSASHAFASCWLVPRLARFRASAPDIDVWLYASDALVDFGFDEVDLAIREGAGDWPGLAVEPVLRETLFPVCAPGLATPERPLAVPGDLAHHTLLHDERPEDWRLWLELAGENGVDPVPGPDFSDSALALQAAAAGQGVALARSVLVARDLAAGRLIKPFPMAAKSASAYYLVAPEERLAVPSVRRFRDWLLSEAGARS